MEISFEEPYDDLPVYQDSSKQKRILISLNNEHLDNRFREPRNMKKHSESPSPISIDTENQPSCSERAQIYKFPISTLTNSSTRSKIDPSQIHKQLKKPNFKQISQIYSNYCKAEDPVVYKIKPRPLPKENSRPSSAPLSRKSVVQDLINQRESEFKRNCTFKPKINNVYGDRGELTQLQKAKQLARPKSELYERRERQKREQEESKLNQCTFRPTIKKYKLGESYCEHPVDERLYQDAELKWYERERIQRLKEDEELGNFPFRPQVQSSIYKLVGNKKLQRPIYERVHEVQQQMFDTRNHIRYLSEINDENLTFKPKINENSYNLASNKKSRTSQCNSRCYSASHSKKFLEDSYAFTPYLTSMSNTNQNFLCRQKQYQARSQARKNAVISRLEANSRNFTPEIDNTSKYLAEYSKYRTSEKLEKRLMEEGVKNMQKRDEMKEQFYAGFTYEPEINPISKSIGKSSSLLEIANNKSNLAMKQKLAEKKAAEEERKNSFTPKLLKQKKFEYVNSSYKQQADLTSTIRKQFSDIQQKREEEKKLKDYEEMRECTFTPQGNIGEISGLDNRVDIKGIDRFMELRSIAKRKELEAKEREKKVFFHNLKTRTDAFTVPQPFNIHPSMKSEKVSRIQAELEQKERAECVFKPKLIEYKKSQYPYSQFDYQYTTSFDSKL